jgi:hypothetical protein
MPARIKKSELGLLVTLLKQKRIIEYTNVYRSILKAHGCTADEWDISTTGFLVPKTKT